MFESLESRRLLTTVSISNGSLTVNGGRADDFITVVENNKQVHVEYSTSTGVITTINVNNISKIYINGGGGDDAIFYEGTTVGATIHGDDNSQGSDYRGGSTGRCGWRGHSGGSGWKNGWSWKKNCGRYSHGCYNQGNDQGDDFITVTDKGSGATTVDGDGGTDSITIVLGCTVSGKKTNVYGGTGNDNIYLNTGVGVYNTAAADTIVYGESGNDIITVYDGRNTINGGDGSDLVIVLGGTNSISSASVA